jgi:integrase
MPESRIKGGKEHCVPLAAPASAIARKMPKFEGSEFLFPCGKVKRSLSNNAMLALLERMGRGDLTVHGFRSTFRDWAAEQNIYPEEVAEMALAYAVGDEVECAYRRGDLLEKRRKLMDAWGRYCSAPARHTQVWNSSGPALR